MENQKPTQNTEVNAIYSFALNLKQKGKNEEQIIEELKKKGLDLASADKVIASLRRVDALRKESGKKNMLVGALLCVGGIIVTVSTYSTASQGGTYVITYGAIILGLVQFIRGLYQFLK